MTLPVIIRPAAEMDIQGIREVLESARYGLSSKFNARLTEVLQRIEEMPELYGVVWQDVRAVRLKRFQYVVYYIVFDDRVEVLAVMHGARDPSVWQSRV